MMPTFGATTIRRFSRNVSELKKMAGRDFEDLLQVESGLTSLYHFLSINMQCAIPAFDGLFPEPYNSAILKLLFLCAHWHGLAKLRSHTDPALDIFDNVTVKTGAAFRHFASNICTDFDTRELPREEGQRKCREAKRKGRTPQNTTANTQSTSAHDDLPDTTMPSISPDGIAPPHIITSSAANCTSSGGAGSPAAHNSMPSLPRENPTAVDGTPQVLLASDAREPSESMTRRNPVPSAHPKISNTSGTSSRKKKFTLNTYKYHACGDYPNTIRQYGTTDSYSTEIVSYSLSYIVSPYILPLG
jgi:hypothetical protein